MRISALAEAAGLPVATVKFYLREGLLFPGVLSSATQAAYDETHVARLRLVRSLIEIGGLSVVRVKAVVDALALPESSPHDVLGVVHGALSGFAEEPPGAGAELIARRRWLVEETSPARYDLERALAAAAAAGKVYEPAHLDVYLDAVEQIAAADVASLSPGADDVVLTEVVIGTVLGEAVLSALRRLAQEDVSARLSGSST